MAKDFHIDTRAEAGRLSIRLSGVLDGTSAYELLNFLMENVSQEKRVDIDTSHLRKIVPFGQAVLQENLPHLQSKMHWHVHFTGRQ